MICGLWAQEGERGGIKMSRRRGDWERRIGGGGLGSVVVMEGMERGGACCGDGRGMEGRDAYELAKQILGRKRIAQRP